MTERIQNFKIYESKKDSESKQQQHYLILIHGLNGNLLTWTPTLAPTLAKETGMTVITLDQPCYGKNPLPFKSIDELLDPSSTENQKSAVDAMLSSLETVMRPPNLAIELHKLLCALNILPHQQHQNQNQNPQQDSPSTTTMTLREEENFYKSNKIAPFLHIFGQSFGGKTAVCFAERYPFLVASLALGDIGICPCAKYDIDTARQLATNSFVHHIEYFPDEPSAKNYVHSVFGGEGGDDVGKKFEFDLKSRGFVSLVRPHVGFIHDFLSRKCDLRDAWAEFEGPVCVFRAGDTFTCLSDSEWRLMKDLRKSRKDDDDDDEKVDDLFVTPSADGFHGVYRSHPELFVSIYSEFLKKVMK